MTVITSTIIYVYVRFSKENISIFLLKKKAILSEAMKK